MKDIELLINKDTGYIENTSSFLIQQENLQRKIIFKFKEGFVDGNAYLCIEKDNAQGKIKLTKNEEQYETTIKSNMVSNTKSIKISLRILQAPIMEYNEEEETEEEQTPIFVSKVSILNVAETIIAEDELPEDLPTWQDTVNEEISELETSVENLSNTKQETLVSGENIKTINNQSILGEGNIYVTVENVDYSNVINKPQINNVTLSGNNSLNDLGIQPAGNYALSSDIPTVPTNISAFTNDVGYLTEHQDITGKEDITNKTTTIDNESTNTQYPSAKAVYDYVERLHTYSTTEQEVGTWIDGKPIYRNIIKATLPTNQERWTMIASNVVSNIDFLVNLYGIYDTTDTKFIFPKGEGSYNINAQIQGTDLYCIRKGWNSVEVMFIIEYTKTTD